MASNEHYLLQQFVVALHNQSVDDGRFHEETMRLVEFVLTGCWGEGNKVTEDFHLTCELDSETPRTIAFIDLKNQERRIFKPSKWLQYLDRQFSLGLDPKAIEYMATTLGEVLPAKWGFDIEIVEGEDLIDGYNITHSCMTRSPALQFYADNPEVVKLVKVLKDGQPHGRALLWTLEDDSLYLDRIYPNQGTHVEALLKHAAKQGWRTRENQSADRSVVQRNHAIPPTKLLKHPEDDSAKYQNSMGPLPFLDTFVFMCHDKSQREFRLSSWERPGYVAAGAVRTQYRDMFFCELSLGWYSTHLRFSGFVHLANGETKKVTANIENIRQGITGKIVMINDDLYEQDHPEVTRHKGEWVLRKELITPVGFPEGKVFHIRECSRLADGHYFPMEALSDLEWREGVWALRKQ